VGGYWSVSNTVYSKNSLTRAPVITSFLMIWVTSTTVFANWFVEFTNQWMHWPTPLQLHSGKGTNPEIKQHDAVIKPAAIVILGGGKVNGVLGREDLQKQDLSDAAYQRVRYAALLARQTKLPILVTGESL
jgi:uncharacterized SAM-binding protein YcdF (DUF218 family)